MAASSKWWRRAETVSTVHTGDAVMLARASYHLGNRHVALQIGAGWLRYQHDHVLDDMLRGFGLEVRVEEAPFEPEGGAYVAANHSHAHRIHTADPPAAERPASDAPQLLRLLHLASPALPIGAFHFSQGLEYAVECGWVKDEASALDWIDGIASASLATLDLPVLDRLRTPGSKMIMQACCAGTLS